MVRAEEVLKRLPAGLVHGAEIGIFRGEMSAILLARPNLLLEMVDSWEGDGSQNHQVAMQAVEFAGSRATVHRQRSVEMAAQVEDAVYDFVFIDADHYYDSVSADIAAWARTIRPGGLLCGHDYVNPEYPAFGVKRAVDEYAAATGRSVELGADMTWFIQL